ncbi:MAG: Gfo/Idh/MocA family oxidoreductase [Burkholderiales bacterium]|nr:Gfo/Idh/MocA family oxidoreductase [Anaerolineae bacterium]
MKTIRWGIIGVGDVTEVKSGPGFQKARNSSLVAVMRRNGALAKDYAERHAVRRWYVDADALINDPDVDAVYIATPPHVHREYTLLCAQAKKPVFVEKPMAMSFAECSDMIDACQTAGVPLWVAYYRRMLPRFLKIKDIIDSGEIGDVRSVVIKLYQQPPNMHGSEILWKYDPLINGGGKFVDMGVHTLDFLDYVLGPIKSVQGSAANQGGLYAAEDHVVASFVFDSGVMGVGDWCSTSAFATDETTIVGTRGEVRFSTFDAEPLLLATESGTKMLPIDNPPHVHQPLIQSIVDELNGIGMCPSTGISGARTTWFTDQVLRDYHQGRSLAY